MPQSRPNREVESRPRGQVQRRVENRSVHKLNGLEDANLQCNVRGCSANVRFSRGDVGR